MMGVHPNDHSPTLWDWLVLRERSRTLLLAPYSLVLYVTRVRSAKTLSSFRNFGAAPLPLPTQLHVGARADRTAHTMAYNFIRSF